MPPRCIICFAGMAGLVTLSLHIGLHLGFAILGIDAFLWLLGEVMANAGSAKHRMYSSVIGLFGYVMTWLIGGYYYVKFYGSLVKPTILAGNAPWAHIVAMEAKEHIFLFVVPLALTIYFISRLNAEELESFGLRKSFIYLIIICAGLGLSFGFLGFIISAAVRWGVV